MNRILLGLMFSIMIPMLIGTAQEAYAGLANSVAFCIDDAGCSPTEFCDLGLVVVGAYHQVGSCVPKLPNGGLCTGNSQCISGLCSGNNNANGNFDGNLNGGICTTPTMIGGTMIPIDSTALLLAGAQSTASWMIPVIVSAIGIGLAVFTLRKK